MENASTGQMRSSNPPPGCGAGCARVRRSRLGVWPHGKVRSAQPVGFRVRLSVRARAQNALFRRVRFSSPAQTWSHLTQRRILRRRPHAKAHSAPATSRKGALRATARMQSAPFGEAHTQNALFRHVAAPGRCGATPPPGCGALWRMPQLGKCARATPRQAAGWVARGFADLGLESGLTERCTLPNRWASDCAFP